MLDEFPETLTSVEWHHPDWSPFAPELTIPEYQIRSEFYGINIIPTTKWNGEQETVGATSGFDWEIMYNTFIPIYNELIGQETPYEIEIEGYFFGGSFEYDVTVTMDDDFDPLGLMKVDVFLVEDNIWSNWCGVWENARNVARDWLISDTLSIDTNGDSETFSFQFNLDENWNPDSLRITAIVQNYTTKKIYQVSTKGIHPASIDYDNDGVLNGDDNCIEVYNPGQEDSDGDLIGDVCDPCDGLVYVVGNLNGDTDGDGSPVIDIMDALTLVDYITTGNSYECQDPILDFNSDGFVNILDIIVLIQIILYGGI